MPLSRKRSAVSSLKSYHVCEYQRHNVINIDITSRSPSRSIIITVPRPTRSSAGTVGLHTRTITLQHILASVAGAADGDPCLEVVALVGRAVALGLDGDIGEVGERRGGRDGCGQVAAAGEDGFDGCCEGCSGQGEDSEGGEDHIGGW